MHKMYLSTINNDKDCIHIGEFRFYYKVNTPYGRGSWSFMADNKKLYISKKY